MDKNTFYDNNSEKAFRCKNGYIRINNVALSEPQMVKFSFCDNVYIVNEFYVVDFTKYLNVLMGFEDVEHDTGLQLFPIVKKFGPNDLLEKCIDVLKPKKMSKEVILTLNLSLRYDCEELMDAVIDYLISYGIMVMLIQEEYYLLLEPKPLLVLLKMIQRDELILRSVVNWGLAYIKNNNVDDDLQGLLKKHQILGKFPIDCLKSVESVLNLYDPNGKNNIFEEKEMLNQLKKIHESEGTKAFIWKSSFSEEGCRYFEECFSFKFPFLLNTSMMFAIQFNPFVYENNIKSPVSGECFSCSVKLAIRKGDSLYQNEEREISNLKISSSESGAVGCQRQIFISSNLDRRVLCSIRLGYSFQVECNILTTKPNLSSMFYENNGNTFTKNITF